MRTLIIILLFFSIGAKAQDTLSYTQFKTAIINMDVVQSPRFVDSPVFKPMMVLGCTFVANTIVGNTMYKNKINPTILDNKNVNIMTTTFTIYLTGATLALILFIYDTVNIQ